MHRYVARLLTGLSLLLAVPAGAQVVGAQVPGVQWATTTPQAAGWSAAGVDQAHAYSDAIGSADVMVVQHGLVVASWGDTSRRLELHSVRKSLLSALIGIAVAEGRINLDATLAQLGIDDVPPALTDAEKQATVRELLQSRSGVYHAALYETDGERRLRPSRGMHEHGTFWYYNNWDFNTLGTIYEHAAGPSIFQALQVRIAQPIGMQDYSPFDGRYVTGAASIQNAYPLHMSGRDLARFGLLFLHGGQWGGRQVVPAAWVAESTQPRSQTRSSSGYGYLWWGGQPGGGGAPLMGLPQGAYWADGAEGQFVVVDPADDLVIVHQTDGTRVTGQQFGHLVWLLRTAAHVPDPGPDPATLQLRSPGSARRG